MEPWSILSNTLNYMQYDGHPKNLHNLGISAVNSYRHCSDAKDVKDMLEIDFGPTPDILKDEYLDVYEGIQSEIVNTTRFNQNSDFSTTYFGRSDRYKNDKLKAEESFPISEQGYTLGKLLDRTECQVQRNHSCQNHSTCIVNHSILCQICFKNTKNSSREWSICQCVICNPSNYRCTWTQIWKLHFGFRNS